MVNTEWRQVDNYNGYGGKWLVVPLAELAFRIEDDGQYSGLFLACASPQGGLPRGVTNLPALLKGDAGPAPSLELGSFIELAHDDVTPARFDINRTVDATAVSGPVYTLDVALHGGIPGNPGAAIITPSDYGTPEYGQQLEVAPGGATFQLAHPRVLGFHPATIQTAAGTTAEAAHAVIDIAAGTYHQDWYPVVTGHSIIIGTGDIQCDLIARLDDATGGDIIGRGHGRLTGTTTQQPNLSFGVESGTGIVAADEAATIFIRGKRISGAVGYAAAESTARFSMMAVAV